jgi:hypothetical protein
MENPTYLETVEQVRNRADKSVLAIKSLRPEKLLAPEVANPKEVKHLWVDMDFSDSDDHIITILENRYTDTLCKDIIHFTNLETLTVWDLNLSSELWTTFARNSTCLKKLVLKSGRNSMSYYDLYDFIETDTCRRDALDALFQIPTLESVIIQSIHFDYFPKGSPTITSMVLNRLGESEESDHLFEGFSEKYPNLTELYVYEYYNNFKLSIVRLDKLTKLEKLFYNGTIEDERDLEILKAVLDLPSLKRIELNCCLGPYTPSKSKCPHIMFSALSTSGALRDASAGGGSELEYPQFTFCNQFYSSLPSTMKPKDMGEFREKLNRIKF